MEFNLVTLGLAAGAGLLSFVSPCVLPLLPAYLGYITGLSREELATAQDAGTRARILFHGLAFVLGLSAVFTVFGASASLVGQVFLQNQSLVMKVAGLLVIVFGLHMMGVIRLPFLYQERRLSVTPTGTGSYGGAFLMGAAFAAGWTPCVGPFLAGLLALASQEQTVYQGTAMLFVYGLGLGVPFLVAGLALNRSLRALKGLKARMATLEVVSGVLLIGMGLLIFSERLALLSGWFTRIFGTGLAA